MTTAAANSPVAVSAVEFNMLVNAYSAVLQNWSLHTDEIAEELRRRGGIALDGSTDDADVIALFRPLAEIDAKGTTRLLKKLAAYSLVVGEHVNGEKPLTWQAFYDIENDPYAEANGMRDFAATFTCGDEVAEAPAKAKSAAKTGATGPRYTEGQISAGLKARREGITDPKTGEWRKATNKQVAEAAGVKSPSYFSKVLKEREAKGRGRQAAKTRATRANKKAGK